MEAIDKETFNKLKERMKAKFPILLEGYLKDSKNYLVTIGTNLPDGDLANVIESAHSLKSASGLLGIMQVHTVAEALEYAAKDLQEKGATVFHGLTPHYEALQNMFAEVEDGLRSELAKIKSF